MRKSIYASLLALAAALLIIASSAGQTKRTTAAAANILAPNGSALLAQLPASDVVIFIDNQRLLTEIVPRVLASDPAKLAKFNAMMDEFKAHTGIDARSFEQIAIGMQLTSQGAGHTHTEAAVIAQGSFNSGALLAAGRIASKGKYREQAYGGKTIYVFTMPEQEKASPATPGTTAKQPAPGKPDEMAVAALNANTLALGSPASVRATIDAGAGRQHVSPELVTLATRDASAVISFGGNVPPSVTQNLDFGNEEVAKSIASIRQFYGSVSALPSGYNMLTVLRTETPKDAQNLNDTLAALKQFVPVLVAQLPADKGKLTQNLADSLKTTTQGNEVQISLTLAQTDVATLIRAF